MIRPIRSHPSVATRFSSAGDPYLPPSHRLRHRGAPRRSTARYHSPGDLPRQRSTVDRQHPWERRTPIAREERIETDAPGGRAGRPGQARRKRGGSPARRMTRPSRSSFLRCESTDSRATGWSAGGDLAIDAGDDVGHGLGAGAQGGEDLRVALEPVGDVPLDDRAGRLQHRPVRRVDPLDVELRAPAGETRGSRRGRRRLAGSRSSSRPG